MLHPSAARHVDRAPQARALRRTPGFLLLVLVGCGGAAPPPAPLQAGQSYPEAMRILCDVDRLAGLSASDDPLEVGRRRSEWLSAKIENPDGIYLKTLISVREPKEQARAIREEACGVGVMQCALADALETSAAGGLSP